MIVPEELKNYSPDQGKTMPGTPSLKIWNGHIVSTNLHDTTFHHGQMRYKYRQEYSKVESTIFQTSDSAEYVYILPIRGAISTFMGDPQQIELLN